MKETSAPGLIAPPSTREPPKKRTSAEVAAGRKEFMVAYSA